MKVIEVPFLCGSVWLDSQCTRMYEDPGSGDKFYNRVFDGEQTSFTWDPVIRRVRLRIRKRVRRRLRKMDHTGLATACWRRSTRGTSKKYNSFQTQSSTTRRNRLLQRRAKSEVMAVVLNASNLVNTAVTVATDLSDNLYSWWSNWASGNEAQSWIGIDLGSAKPVKHVRFMNGRGWPTGKEGVIEFSDDMHTWTEWSGDRITTEARAQQENQGSKNNKWQEAAVVSAPAPAPPTVAATGSKYWKVTNADALGWRPNEEFRSVFRCRMHETHLRIRL